MIYKQEITDWLYHHGTSFNDAIHYFNEKPNRYGEYNFKKATKESLLDWIQNHTELYKDFIKYFKKEQHMTHKTNYRKYYGKDGTVYRQTIHISKKEYKKVLQELEKNKNNYFEGDKCYGSYSYMTNSMKIVKGKKHNIIYPSTTPARFIARVLNIENFKYDRNVRFIIDN